MNLRCECVYRRLHRMIDLVVWHRSIRHKNHTFFSTHVSIDSNIYGIPSDTDSHTHKRFRVVVPSPCNYLIFYFALTESRGTFSFIFGMRASYTSQFFVLPDFFRFYFLRRNIHYMLRDARPSHTCGFCVCMRCAKTRFLRTRTIESR